tara:strand:- start:481 stop:1236 length:756 start_codon:yes stop_codon:yes gene_type:complete
MGINSLKSVFKKKSYALGTWISIPSAINVDIIAASDNIDFLIFDREHGPTSFEEIQQMVIATKSRNKLSIIRPRDLSESEILSSLDLGVDGLQISNISSAEQVQTIKDYAFYPPKGNRGFSPFNRANNYSRKYRPSFKKLNNALELIINVEGLDGLKNLDSICKNLPVGSIIFIGAYDLSKALGIPGLVEDKRVYNELERASKIISDHKLFPGTIASSNKQLQKLIAIGYKYIPFLADTEMLLGAYDSIQR